MPAGRTICATRAGSWGNVIVIDPVIVAALVNGNETVEVIDTVIGQGSINASQRFAPTARTHARRAPSDHLVGTHDVEVSCDLHRGASPCSGSPCPPWLLDRRPHVLRDRLRGPSQPESVERGPGIQSRAGMRRASGRIDTVIGQGSINASQRFAPTARTHARRAPSDHLVGTHDVEVSCDLHRGASPCSGSPCPPWLLDRRPHVLRDRLRGPSQPESVERGPGIQSRAGMRRASGRIDTVIGQGSINFVSIATIRSNSSNPRS